MKKLINNQISQIIKIIKKIQFNEIIIEFIKKKLKNNNNNKNQSNKV